MTNLQNWEISSLVLKPELFWVSVTALTAVTVFSTELPTVGRGLQLLFLGLCCLRVLPLGPLDAPVAFMLIAVFAVTGGYVVVSESHPFLGYLVGVGAFIQLVNIVGPTLMRLESATVKRVLALVLSPQSVWAIITVTGVFAFVASWLVLSPTRSVAFLWGTFLVFTGLGMFEAAQDRVGHVVFLSLLWVAIGVVAALDGFPLFYALLVAIGGGVQVFNLAVSFTAPTSSQSGPTDQPQ